MKIAGRILILLTSFLFFQKIFSQDIHSEKIDSYINYIKKNNLDIGSISIFRHGKEVYFNSFGKIENQKFHNSTAYQVGSITKLFTAVLIFKLIEENKISLNDKLSRYFPTIKNSDNITIKNLLEHSSGLNNYVKKNEKIIWLKEPRTDREIMEEIVNQRILFSPNENVLYSNSGYYLLGKIIEKEFNKNYGQVLKDQITQPFKLSETKSAYENPKHIAGSYIFDDQTWHTAQDFYFKNIIGVGDISSNTQNLNTFINALFNHKVLLKETIDIMKPFIGKETYGRGLMTFNFHSVNFYGNTGGTYGTNTILLFDEQTETSIALIINGERYPRNEFINDIVDIIYNNNLKFPENTN
ncbi:D-alanyl-D-alanine carboxypeptidase [Chryseobacterium sp. 52]|uniref:serine hydrolase domain-containing protein n=1 Tax=Chryseobacterium sp. 52 TaxID=2035213 RepID=UPI000C186E3E|nr:serine hydrolase domain-containing protein [Chryseobacterium sp. 52]PIF47507.1 D-alanyl-D-alanine carboxypeptidase [Chryseobacterium sp. 52]